MHMLAYKDTQCAECGEPNPRQTAHSLHNFTALTVTPRSRKRTTSASLQHNEVLHTDTQTDTHTHTSLAPSGQYRAIENTHMQAEARTHTHTHFYNIRHTSLSHKGGAGGGEGGREAPLHL